jgi:hypothetical protein
LHVYLCCQCTNVVWLDLDITDFEQLTHLLQLFFAAHPRYQSDNAHLRMQTGLLDAQFVSLPMSRDLAAWARQRHLITRAAAARLVNVMEQVTGQVPDEEGH